MNQKNTSHTFVENCTLTNSNLERPVSSSTNTFRPSKTRAHANRGSSSQPDSGSSDDDIPKTTESISAPGRPYEKVKQPVPPTSDSTSIVPDPLKAIAHKYEIQMTMARRLLALQDYEIVIVVDDSGSMKTLVDGTRRTRWDELCEIVKIVLEIGTVFDSNGVDIYFINGREYLRVKDPAAVDEAFKIPPRGYTPLVRTLNRVFQLPAARPGHEKHLLVFVATDGAPTDDEGNEIVPELEKLMREKRQVETTYVSFLLCTDQPNYVEYMNKWDQTMKNVDVTDDFRTERETIRRYRGNNYPFSFGDYVVHALVGAIDPEIDKINEP